MNPVAITGFQASERVGSLLAVIGLACAPLTGAELAGSSFGEQPVAIGAGARALGMGGAFSAVADDATAGTWNPAGLTQCERPEFAASLGWWHARVKSDGDDRSDQTLRPEHLSLLQPWFAFGCMQVAGVAWQRQYDFARSISWESTSFVDNDPFQIATSDDQEFSRQGAFSSLGLSYAIEARPGLSCGVTLNQWADAWTRASSYEQHSQERTTTIFSFMGVPDPATVTDLISDSSTRVLQGTSYTIGLTWQATPALTLAVVAKPGYTLDLETDTTRRTITDDGINPIQELSVTSSSESALHHPSSATIGLAWRHADLDTITCDAVWTRWSGYYSDEELGRYSPVNPLVAPEDFDDLWSLRLGYEHVAILERVILVPRCGMVAEWLPATTAAPSLAATSEVSATSDLWLGLTAGFSLVQRRVIWDVAVQVRRGDDIGAGAGQFAPPDSSADVTITTAKLGVTLPF